MIKKAVLLLLSLSSFILISCDKEALDGLNIKINADIKSDYEKEKATENSQSSEVTATSETKSPVENAKTENNQNAITNNQTTMVDGDQPMPFKAIAECTPAGITVTTNEQFYANSGVKSVNSKNSEELKKWQELYNKIEAECKK
ncbi:MAG: hypothetical protein IGQ45_00150 [Cyanobacterium sp. T60_A2020_053]|nr:hypothetical protein [Cyanobacterium sp. T60_A2020_053]